MRELIVGYRDDPDLQSLIDTIQSDVSISFCNILCKIYSNNFLLSYWNAVVLMVLMIGNLICISIVPVRHFSGAVFHSPVAYQ